MCSLVNAPHSHQRAKTRTHTHTHKRARTKNQTEVYPNSFVDGNDPYQCSINCHSVSLFSVSKVSFEWRELVRPHKHALARTCTNVENRGADKHRVAHKAKQNGEKIRRRRRKTHIHGEQQRATRNETATVCERVPVHACYLFFIHATSYVFRRCNAIYARKITLEWRIAWKGNTQEKKNNEEEKIINWRKKIWLCLILIYMYEYP